MATGEHYVWDTMTEAAECIGTNSQYLAVKVREHKPIHGWCVAHDEHTAKMMYECGGQIHAASEAPKGKLVQLRIDSRTVIWVKPHEANEMFAESYRDKLLEG